MKINRIKLIIIIFIIVFSSYIFSSHFYQLALINGDSMSPTLKNNQVVLINKYNKVYSNGDIVAFRSKYYSKILIKRIAASEGDNIYINNGKLYVNGVVEEKYINKNFKYEGILSKSINNNGITLNDNQYIVLGDNVNNSEDSRSSNISIVSNNDIIGKAVILKE